jgi:hypothetical protein
VILKGANNLLLTREPEKRQYSSALLTQ